MDSHLPSLRDYTETELLALPADSRLLFADNIRQGLLTYDNPPPSIRRRRLLQPPSAISPATLQTALHRVRALRCLSHGISTFALYPTTDQQHTVNRFLWRAANHFAFDAREAAHLFQRNVFVVSMPSSLFDFLTSVTWEQLENAMLFVLTNLAQASRGMAILQEELAPCLVSRLDQFNALPDQMASVDPKAFRLMLDLLMDRIVCMGAWLIPTTLCYLSASDMTELLARRYDRSIFSTPEKFELVHTMMWNIYRDWQVYRHVLVKNGARTRLQALELMAKTIAKGTQGNLHLGISTLSDLASEIRLPPSPKASYFSMLPMDIILCKLMPNICDVYADDHNPHHTARSSGGPSSAPFPPDHPSSVTVPFSLKSWVLENHRMNQLYTSALSDSEDEDEEDVDGHNDQAPGQDLHDPQPGNTLAEIESPQQQENNAQHSITSHHNDADEMLQDEGCTTDAPSSLPEFSTSRICSEDEEQAIDDTEGCTNDSMHNVPMENDQGCACNTHEAVEELDNDAFVGATYQHSRGECEQGMLSPRTLRRRLNEQGCFEAVSGQSSAPSGSGCCSQSA